MFSLRKEIGGNRQWDSAFITKLVTDLQEAGFNKSTFKIPIDKDFFNTSLDQQNSLEEKITHLEIPYKEFIDQERNYPAVIFVAINEKLKDQIKILFVNTSKETKFNDNTFPSGHSVPSQIYVQSPDPSRVYGLINFFYSYLTLKESSNLKYSITGLIAFFLLGLETIHFFAQKLGFLQKTLKISPLFDFGIILLSIYWFYRFFSTPTGLSVNKRETATFLSFINRAIKGDLRDNPLVNILVVFLIDLIVAVILKIIGLN